MFDSLYKQLPDNGDEANQSDDTILLYKTYCPINGDEPGKCNSNLDKISAGLGYLLPQLFGNVESEEDHEEQEGNYVYYGLLWTSYKLQQLPPSELIDLNQFYDNYIKNNVWFESYLSDIDTKKNLMSVDTKTLSDLYHIFKEMCKIFYNNGDDDYNLDDFTGYYKSAINCAKNYSKQCNNADTDTSGNTNFVLYDMLKHVYDDFKKGYYKNNPQANSFPEIPEIEEIKEPLISDSENLDSLDSTDENIETQDGGSENSDFVENSDQVSPECELGEPQNNETVDQSEDLVIVDEKCLKDFEIKLPNYFDGLEVSDIEVEYPDVQEELVYIDTEFSKLEYDLPFFEDKYLDLENDPQYIIDELYVSKNELSNSVMKPQIIDIDFPNFDIEQNDFDNQSQPDQTITLAFDDPFKNPENFSDNIMCKLHGPKSVYCNRIICNRIKIGVIALSIPVVLVFIYKVINKTITIYILLNMFATTYI